MCLYRQADAVASFIEIKKSSVDPSSALIKDGITNKFFFSQVNHQRCFLLCGVREKPYLAALRASETVMVFE